MIDFRQAVYSALALSSHISDLELHRDAVDLFLRHNRKRITRAGCYSRDMIYIENSKRIERRIEIIRFRFNNDPSFTTHSLSSDILIPFGSYTVRFVLHVMNVYYKHDRSVSDLCAYFAISSSTLHDWKKLFEAHAMSYVHALSLAVRIHNDLLSLINYIPGFPHLFYVLFDVHFLRSRYRSFELLTPSQSRSP